MGFKRMFKRERNAPAQGRGGAGDADACPQPPGVLCRTRAIMGTS